MLQQRRSGKMKKKDEIQAFLESHPCMSKLRVLVAAFSLRYWAPFPRGQGLSHGIQLLEAWPLLEPVSHAVYGVFVVKVFRLFRSEWSFLGFRVCTQCTTSYVLARPACSWCLCWYLHYMPHECVLTPSSSYDVKTLVKKKYFGWSATIKQC